jgi:hypothetical protein
MQFNKNLEEMVQLQRFLRTLEMVEDIENLTWFIKHKIINKQGDITFIIPLIKRLKTLVDVFHDITIEKEQTNDSTGTNPETK